MRPIVFVFFFFFFLYLLSCFGCRYSYFILFIYLFSYRWSAFSFLLFFVKETSIDNQPQIALAEIHFNLLKKKKKKTRPKMASKDCRLSFQEIMELTELPVDAEAAQRGVVRRFMSRRPAWLPGSDIERIEELCGEGKPFWHAPLASFGGHVYAQSGMAAARVVDAEEKAGPSDERQRRRGVHVSACCCYGGPPSSSSPSSSSLLPAATPSLTRQKRRYTDTSPPLSLATGPSFTRSRP